MSLWSATVLALGVLSGIWLGAYAHNRFRHWLTNRIDQAVDDAFNHHCDTAPDIRDFPYSFGFQPLRDDWTVDPDETAPIHDEEQAAAQLRAELDQWGHA